MILQLGSTSVISQALFWFSLEEPVDKVNAIR